MIIESLSSVPYIPFLVAAVLVPLLKGRMRSVMLLLVPGWAFFLLMNLPDGAMLTFDILGNTLILLRVDSLSRMFAIIFVIMAFLGNLYGIKAPPGQHAASQIYVASSIGAVLAGDLLTLFLFWEIMAVASVFLVWGRRNTSALKAGFRYLLVHMFGGGLFLAGLVLNYRAGSPPVFESLQLNPGGWLILAAFALNAAIPPLNAWLSDAYPEATIPGAVFLCVFTTKTAVYALARGFPGMEILVWAGAIMAIYGVIFAILENDIRRLLSYHIISQVGYMVCGIGLGTALSVSGASAHAFCHILYKGLLFMAAGAVIHVTGRSKLTELGGLARSMPLTTLFFMIGAFSIAGVPLFSGFVSKSMIVSASSLRSGTLELMLMVASVGTFLSIALKLAYSTFFGKPSGEGPVTARDDTRHRLRREPPGYMLLAMGLASFLCVLFGVWPELLYRILPYPVEYHPYTGPHVIGSLQLFLWVGLGFMILLRKLKPKPAITLDTDWIYRRGAPLLIRGVIRLQASAVSAVSNACKTLAAPLARAFSGLWENPAGAWKTLWIPYDDQRRYRPLLGVHVTWILAAFLAAALVILKK